MADMDMAESERLKQLAAQMREAEYKGLSEEEIRERERQKEMRKKKNIDILCDTLDILNEGRYVKDAQEIKLCFSQEEVREIRVFMPEDIAMLSESSNVEGAHCAPEADALENNDLSTEAHACDREAREQNVRGICSCENEDALVLAHKKYQNLKQNGEQNPQILVLNLASATQAGGHVRQGAGAQEEDLCRRTSLLLSLESEDAKKYYDYNNSHKTRMGSDAVMISPNVEVIKDGSSELLSEPFRISVMSCAAPMVRLGLEGMTQREYEVMLYQRIQGMLLVAASQGYRHLVLGAFGCGVYGNDAAVVSDLFYRAICSFSYAGKGSDVLFDSIDFAVLCSPGKDYNYQEFSRNFA